MRRALPLLCAVSGLGLLATAPAAAQPRCSERNFSATGAPGLIHFLGRRHASAAWSAKVRSELGDAYAAWGRAQDRHIECVIAQRRFLCSASGVPCRAFRFVSACPGPGCR
jgi:hypothetical protein